MSIHRSSILGLLLMLSGCGQDRPAGHADVTTDAGLRTELRIGVVEGEPEYQFVGIARVEEGPNDEIVVLDSGARVVRVYTAEGVHIRSFGRQGSGPGEFGSPMSMRVSGDTVLVLDRSQGIGLSVRVHLFSLDGTLHKTFETPIQYETVSSAASTPSNWITVGTISFQAQLGDTRSRERPIHEYLVARYVDLEAAAIAEPHLRVEGTPRYLLGELGWVRSPFFAATPAITVSSSGRIYVAAGSEYRIDIHSPDGRLERTIAHDVPRIPVQESDFEEALNLELQEVRSRPENSESARFLAMLQNDYPRIPRAEYRPITGRIFVSDGGRVMVERLDRDETPFVNGDGSSWDLLEPDGSITKQIDLPGTYIPLMLTDTHLFARERDELDVQHVTKLSLGL